MPSNHLNAATGWRVWCLLIGLPIAITGCTQNWWNAFLDPSQTGNFRSNEIVEIQESISFYDKPLGIPGATDPTPEDAVAYVEEYRIGPGDVLSIRMLDFFGVGTENDLGPITVNELGYLNIPQLGMVQAEGRTANELQQDLIQLSKQAGIFAEDAEPVVIISVLTALQRVFHISGPPNMVNSGMYAISRPDFRLREAINLAGGLDSVVKHVYVIRNQPREKRVREGTMRPGILPPVNPETMPAPPVGPMTLSETGSMAGAANQPAADEPARSNDRPTTRLAVPREDAERELMDALNPDATAQTQSSSSTAPSENTPEAKTAQPKWIFLNDSWVETKPAPETPVVPPTQPSTPVAQPVVPQAESNEAEPVNWEELAQEGQQRIIRIPADRLRNGEPSVDIVVRPHDWIRLDPGPVGLFYLGGHVVRPGTYNFTGEEITLRQAILSGGGLDGLAWPSRCSITRRIDQNREEILQLDLARIMEGKDPDFYLKPNDLIDVGTHAIAPLLATIRNSFRLTYGFGFVYDRNFADLDAYFPQQNPTDRRRVALQSRFPGLLP